MCPKDESDRRAGRKKIKFKERSIKITRAYVTAFFEQSLKAIPRPLLDRPSKAYPEVVFHTP